MELRSRRMVLREGQNPEDVEEVIRALGGSEDTRVVREFFGGRREVEWPIGDDLKLVQGEDGTSHCRYVQVLGDDEDDVMAAIESCEESLRPWSYEDLIRFYDLASGSEEGPHAVLRLALGAPPSPDDDFVARVLKSLGSSDPEIRDAGVLAAATYALSAFVPRLSELASSDADPEVRDTARATLEAYAGAGLT
ncbi:MULTISPECIES: HEAT repeat domain-containing protein [Kitasatospora]|nr:HEAT repeat domain-containing protein [Kitasatospora xanthocidica]